jgi:methionine synthase II (cobalamin-independent)
VVVGGARDPAPLAPDRWFVLDEPVFQSIGTPFFPGSPELALEAVNAVIASTSARVTWGLHVCGNTDFSILSRLDIGLFHFDAYMAWDALRLYRDDLRSFIASGGVVALGAVPVSAEPGEAERAVAIVRDAAAVLGDLGQREMPVGPACGMRAVTVERAVEVGGLIRRLITPGDATGGGRGQA